MTTRINIDGYTYEYNSDTGNLVFTKYTGTDINTITPTIEEYNEFTFTVNSLPTSANITLTAEGYQTVTGNGTCSITVREGTIVNYTIYQQGYSIESGSYTINYTQSITVEIIPQLYTLTIDPIPADAVVNLVLISATVDLEGYDYISNESNDVTITQYIGNNQNPVIPIPTSGQYIQVNNSITAPYGSQIRVTVSKLTYNSQQFTYTITQDETLHVRLRRNGVMFLYNYGSCVICFMLGGTREWDLGQVSEEYEDAYDMGTNMTTGQYDDIIDLGEV